MYRYSINLSGSPLETHPSTSVCPILTVYNRCLRRFKNDISVLCALFAVYILYTRVYIEGRSVFYFIFYFIDVLYVPANPRSVTLSATTRWSCSMAFIIYIYRRYSLPTSLSHKHTVYIYIIYYIHNKYLPYPKHV